MLHARQSHIPTFNCPNMTISAQKMLLTMLRNTHTKRVTVKTLIIVPTSEIKL
jgi:hypothetical protein